MYSGGVAGAAFAAVRGGEYEAIVLVGPSHYVGFDGAALPEADVFGTPLGELPVEQTLAQQLAASPFVVRRADAHAQEHSLEMELPFVARLFPGTPIVPLVMGEQTRETIEGVADALARACANRHLLLVASSDLSHFFDAQTANRLDGRVADLVEAFDADGLVREMDRYPLYERGRYVMCGGGPVVAVMRAARALGASRATVLAHSHSGLISGDNDRVVGYLAAAFSDTGNTEGSHGSAVRH
jgi:AmmeMemoRadiSam system protein B